MVSLKGLNNNIGLGRLITAQPLFSLPGLAWVFTLSFALTGVNVKTVLWYTSMHLQIGQYIWLERDVWTVYSVEEKYEFLNYKYLFENWECAKTCKISLRQKVSSPENAKICLRQNFSFYSI